MRRILSFGLVGLGVFAVALGLMLRLYAYPKQAKVPLNVSSKSVATGSDVTALMFTRQADGRTFLPEIKTGLNVTATRVVTGDLTQPEVVRDGDVAVWIEVVEVVDQNDNRVKATERELCLDRRTNEARQPCTTQYVQTKTTDNNEPVREDGIAQPGISFKFPFDTEKRSYQVYDLSLRDQAEAKFDGEDNINGLDVYRFVQEIPPTKIEAGRKVPGTLINDPEASVTVDLYYQNKRTMWVEPTTGQIVKGQEEQLQELRKPDLPEGTAVFKGTLTFDDATVNELVTEANDNKSKLWLLTGLPTILWIAGALLIALGIGLAIFFSRGDGGRGRGSNQPGPPPHRELADASR